MPIINFTEADWKKINECVEVMADNFNRNLKEFAQGIKKEVIMPTIRCISILCLLLLIYGLCILPHALLTYQSINTRLNEGRVLNMVPTKFLKPFSAIDKNSFEYPTLLSRIRESLSLSAVDTLPDKVVDLISTFDESTLFFLFKYAITTERLHPLRGHTPKSTEISSIPIQPKSVTKYNYASDIYLTTKHRTKFTERPVMDEDYNTVDSDGTPLKAVVYNRDKNSIDHILLMNRQYEFYQEELDRAYNVLSNIDNITFHSKKTHCNPGVTGKTFHKDSCMTSLQLWNLYAVFKYENPGGKLDYFPPSKVMYNNLVKYHPTCHYEQCLMETIMHKTITPSQIYSIFAPVRQLAADAIHTRKQSLHVINANDVENVLNQYIDLHPRSAYYSMHDKNIDNTAEEYDDPPVDINNNINLTTFNFRKNGHRKFVIGVFNGDSVSGIYIDFDKEIIFYYDPDGASVIFPSVLQQIKDFLNAHPKFTYYVNPYCQYHVRKDNQAYVINFLVNMLHGSEDIHKKIYKFQVTGVDEDKIMSDRDNVWFNKPMKPMIDGLRPGHNHFKSHTGKSFTVGRDLTGGKKSRKSKRTTRNKKRRVHSKKRKIA